MRNISFAKGKGKKGERREKGGFLQHQENDSTDSSSDDLPGKGAKLGYYVIVYEYVYVCCCS